MTASSDIWAVLRTIDDPEMPISIVDLGMIARVALDEQTAAGAACVEIDVTPTFIGCPAQVVIEQEIRRRVAALPGVASVRVNFVYDPPWSVDRISPAGRESLHRAGITVPQRDVAAAAAPPAVQLGLPALRAAEIVHCPLCGADATTLESAFGPTRCKMIYYCQACKNQFEHMKRV